MTTKRLACPICGCRERMKEGRWLCAAHWAMAPTCFKTAVMAAASHGAGCAAHQAAMDAIVRAVERIL